MAGILKRIFRFLNRDFTGKTWERETTHPYFGQMVFFGHRDPAKCYWEAELSHSDLEKKVGVTLKGAPSGPEPSEEAFCRQVMSDLDTLFARCRDAFRAEFPKWTKDPFPSDWRQSFSLDGFSVPRHGDIDGKWDVCYFAKPAGHFFTAQLDGGHVARVVVDG
jgi:hypothetical protein